MCHAVAAAAPAVHCNGIQLYKGAAWEEGRLLLLSSGGVINYLALWCLGMSTNVFIWIKHGTHRWFEQIRFPNFQNYPPIFRPRISDAP